MADHPLNRLDGLWRLMMAGWTANITLMVNLAAKFLGLVGGAAIAVPSVLGLQLPVFSKMDSRGGVTSYQAGKLGDAEQSFQKAIALDGENADAHYMGSLYNHLEQPEKAKKEYLIAIAGDVPSGDE